MVKEPRPGRVKTRLGRELGPVPAAWWFRHQVRALLRRLEDPRWDLVLAVSPDREGMQSRVWPAHLPRVAQGGGDLGDRMGRLLAGARPGAPVCVIGADIPGITRAQVARAFAALGRADAVIGPAPDGGYWLIGLKGARQAPRGLFHAVRWSTGQARADTEATLAGLRIARVAELADVDTLADLRAAAVAARAARGLWAAPGGGRGAQGDRRDGGTAGTGVTEGTGARIFGDAPLRPC